MRFRRLFYCLAEVINESHMHSVPKGAETHFKVVVVSDQFDGLSLLQRHREVNTVLQGSFLSVSKLMQSLYSMTQMN